MRHVYGMMPFYRILLRSLLLIFSLCLIASTPAFGGTITLGGTGSSLGTMKRMGEAFMESHPGVEVVVMPSLGSTGGIKAAIAGVVDIGLSGRPLKKEETEKGLRSVEYARSPFLLVANSEVSSSELRMEQLVGIYRGDVDMWPDGTPLRLIMRPERESDTVFLRSISPEMEEAVLKAYSREGLIMAITDQETADKLEQVPGAFGVSTLCQIVSEGRRVRILSFGGVAPTTENVVRGTYPFFRTFRLVVGLKPSDLTRDFVTFIFSEEGGRVLEGTGNARIPRPGALFP